MDKQDSTETKFSILSARIEQLHEKLDKKDGLLAGFAKNCLEHLARYLIIAVLAIGVFFVVKDMAFSGVSSVLSIPGKGIDWVVARPGNLSCRFLDSTCRMEDGERIYELIPETEMSEEGGSGWCLPFICDDSDEVSETEAIPVEEVVVNDIESEFSETEVVVSEEEPGLLSWRPKRPEWTKWGKTETEGEESP